MTKFKTVSSTNEYLTMCKVSSLCEFRKCVFVADNRRREEAEEVKKKKRRGIWTFVRTPKKKPKKRNNNEVFQADCPNT